MTAGKSFKFVTFPESSFWYCRQHKQPDVGDNEQYQIKYRCWYKGIFKGFLLDDFIHRNAKSKAQSVFCWFKMCSNIEINRYAQIDKRKDLNKG